MTDLRLDELKVLLPRCLTADWVRLGARLVRLLRDQNHPARHDALLDRLLLQTRASVARREQRRLRVPRLSYPHDLPITVRKDEIVGTLRAHQVVVIAGETGSGKTTQLPKMCLEAGLGIEGKIGCTQPRRVAALSISRRLADELGVAWGREVGCKIRFDDRSSAETYIKLMTDGILLAETQGDPLLTEYNALIIDEAHERSLNIDFLLGHLKGLLAHRPDLKLIVTSATIDTQAFARHFGGAPVIEVSGRMFPVEVRYAPSGREDDPGADASGDDVTFIEAAARATERLLRESTAGDVLVFLPGERDIREAGDLLTGGVDHDVEIIPLYGRLSAGDQQRVFAPSASRRVILATNIAETSLTIPGIRYVVDAGLARISRYNPRTRTKRLPVEPVSQSSANQRKGRAGRVAAGVCLRLYSEEDFQARPPYTQPEIQRANLAEVILRMKAFRLGEMETFPFINPPTPAAVTAGYALLQELGALDAQRELTPLGRQLARLPIDPTLGRMLLQSQHEHAPHELLIIAAGLSIQDPRERPLDRRAEADAAHRRHADPRSDFLGLLNLWNAVHDQWESLRTQNARRRFCRQHFLSYTRMREWQDLHAQLLGALEELGTLTLNESSADYAAIHRSILAGMLGHVACREERNTYKGAGNRRVHVFPGSALFERGEPSSKRGSTKPAGTAPTKPKSAQPAWIVAGEIVETSELFARTIAGIDPEWILQLAPHFCQVVCRNPHWSPSAGRVLAEEIASLHGLEILRRKVAFGNVNPKEATAIFIRSALVEENLWPEPQDSVADRPAAGRRSLTPEDQRRLLASTGRDIDSRRPAYPFLNHNRVLREKIETWQTRVRRPGLASPDDALFKFYSERLEHVSSIHELNRLLAAHAGESQFLCASESDLTGGDELHFDVDAFPEAVAVSGQPVPLAYAYAPGEAWDGVTIRLPVDVARTAPGASLEWAVPGLRAEQVGELLRSLPGALRRALQPIPPKIDEIVRDLEPTGASLRHDLSRFLKNRFGVVVPLDEWKPEKLPAHLRPRFEVVGSDQKPVAAGRDLSELRAKLEQAKVVAPRSIDPGPAWRRAAEQWERPVFNGSGAWVPGELPERLTISEGPGLPVYAWPGLADEVAAGHGVVVRLYRSTDAARRGNLAGWQRLVEQAVSKDLTWLERDLRSLARHRALYAPLGTAEELQGFALTCARRHVLPAEGPKTPNPESFERAVAEARTRLTGLAHQLDSQVLNILTLRQQLAARLGPAPAPAIPVGQRPKPATLSSLSQLALPGSPPAGTKASSPGLATELAALVPRDFLEATPFAQLQHLPRYLKALQIRAERAANDPGKHADRVRQLTPYVEAWSRLASTRPGSAEAARLREEFRWMIEEFKVSLFAQELRTARPVSAKRLDELLERVREAAPM